MATVKTNAEDAVPAEDEWSLPILKALLPYSPLTQRRVERASSGRSGEFDRFSNNQKPDSSKDHPANAPGNSDTAEKPYERAADDKDLESDEHNGGQEAAEEDEDDDL
jgi:hypothetical protein